MPDSSARNDRGPTVDTHLPMPESTPTNRSKRASREYARYENPTPQRSRRNSGQEVPAAPGTADVEHQKVDSVNGYKLPWEGDGMPGPLEFTRKFMGGLRNDIRRRLVKHFKSDYTDAFTKENFAVIAPSILFLFFACYAPALAFGALFGTLLRSPGGRCVRPQLRRLCHSYPSPAIPSSRAHRHCY